jgi:ABC-type cobalt transport system substrate-binding protein
MRRSLALLLAVLCPAVLTACASTASSGSFKGAEHEAAQTISNLQADATSGSEKKLCGNDLSAGIVNRLGGIKGCEAAIKAQLGETDNLEATIVSVKVAANGTAATAQVNGIYRGKKKVQAVSLVKEDGKWRVSGL